MFSAVDTASNTKHVRQLVHFESGVSIRHSVVAAVIAVPRRDYLPDICCGGSKPETRHKQEPNSQHKCCGNISCPDVPPMAAPIVFFYIFGDFQNILKIVVDILRKFLNVLEMKQIL